MWRNKVKPETMDHARRLREHPTPSEELLWEHLGSRRFHGYTFRRQHVLLGWIVDFFCPRLRLVVEVDGPYHVKQRDHDAARDMALRDRYVHTVRIEAARVFTDMDGVLAEIKAGLDAQIAAGVAPSCVVMRGESRFLSEGERRFRRSFTRRRASRPER
jgi:very-short-patch-repair endonuclease